MILTCPSCGTQYVVKDGAIPPGGRQVRCTACKHHWHQDPEGTSAGEDTQQPATAEVAPELETPHQDEESVAEATLIEPRSGPELEERAFEEASLEEAREPSPDPPADEAGADSGTYSNASFDIIRRDEPAAGASDDHREPPEAEPQDDEFSPFAAPDGEQPRKRSALLTVLIVAILVIAIAAAFWFLAPPEWKAQLGLGAAGTSPLALVTTHMDRQRLESGNELLTVTGRVINPTSKEQSVPPLQAQLKTKAGKVVYTWTIAPPARTLPAGASASFNSAEVNVPPGGDELTISLGSGNG
jgi:predicted Zn finger-like uncharacterized protein